MLNYSLEYGPKADFNELAHQSLWFKQQNSWKSVAIIPIRGLITVCDKQKNDIFAQAAFVVQCDGLIKFTSIAKLNKNKRN